MSEDPIIEGRIILDKLNEDLVFKGVLLLTSKEDIVIENVEIALYKETRGRLSSKKLTIFVHSLGKKVRLEKYVQIEIPFQMILRTYQFESYVGKNFSFAYSCEATFRVSEDFIEKNTSGFYDKVSKFFSSNDNYGIECDVELIYPHYEYQTVDSDGNFEAKPKMLSVPILFLFAALTFIVLWKFNIVDFLMHKFDIDFSIDFRLVIFIVFVFAFLSLLWNGLNYIFEKLLALHFGIVHVKIKKAEEGFNCHLKKPFDYRLKDQSLYYEIIEEVEDNRGTSSSTYSENIYTSEVHKISETKNSQDVFFKLPDQSGLESKATGDIYMYWRMIFSGTYLGISFSYSYKFRVEYDAE